MLDPDEFAVLIKMHPDDNGDRDYKKFLREHGFDVKIIRGYLHESIQIADIVFA